MSASAVPFIQYERLEEDDLEMDMEECEKSQGNDAISETTEESHRGVYLKNRGSTRIRTRTLVFMAIWCLILGLASLWTLLHNHFNISEASRPRNPKLNNPSTYVHRERPCGWTANEARAAGCTFDIMTATWLPKECYDDEISSSFREHGPWEFYTNTSDFEFTKEIRWPSADQLRLLPNETALSEETFVWATRRYHLTHCIFLLRRLHRLVDGGAILDSALESYHHSKHCGDMIEKSLDGGGPIPMDLVMTFVVVGFPSC